MPSNRIIRMSIVLKCYQIISLECQLCQSVEKYTYQNVNHVGMLSNHIIGMPTMLECHQIISLEC